MLIIFVEGVISPSHHKIVHLSVPYAFFINSNKLNKMLLLGSPKGSSNSTFKVAFFLVVLSNEIISNHESSNTITFF